MKLRAVFLGDEYTTAASDSVGFVRKRASEAGVIVEDDTVTFFVPWRELDALRDKVRGRK